MRVITYRITVLEPTLVTALEGDPNEAVAFDYLPGSVLRGAVIRKYLRSSNRIELNAANANERRLFFNGTTRYLNAYPTDRLGRRTLPTPQSWQQKKGEATDIFDFAVEMGDADDQQWQGVREPFCSLDEQKDEGKPEVRLVNPARHIAVHTARTRRFGRPMPHTVLDRIAPDEVPGAVYRYDALAAGQTFEAVVLCDNDADASQILSLLTGRATLGGSRSSGYGRVSLHDAKEVDNWREAGNDLLPDLNGKLIVTFLSDALLRDDHGQFVVDPYVVTEKLSQRLGTSLRLCHAFLGGEVLGGFNRKWGLPLPQTLAIRRGSVFVFDKPDCDESRLHLLEAHGIGERRAEGFGRVAVNWHTEAELRVDQTPASAAIPTANVQPGSDSERLLKQMAQRLQRRRLDELLIARVHEVAIVNAPTNAQLSRLRNILHDELLKESPDPQRILDFLHRIKERNTARRQFERARVGAKTLWDWLETCLRINDERAWKSLLGFQEAHTCKVGNMAAPLTDELRAEYLLRLIDVVLARTVQDRRKEGEAR